jgi:Subtilase family
MLYRTAAAAILILMLMVATANAAWIDPALEERLDLPGDEMVRVLVIMNEQVDLEAVINEVEKAGGDLAKRHFEVITRLRDIAATTQGDLESRFSRDQARGRIEQFKSFWIVNGFALTAKASYLREAIYTFDVMSVILDHPIELIEPVATGEPEEFTAAAKGVENGIALTGAPDLWAMGFTGEGTIACNQDTGVAAAHAALGGRWRGSDAGVSAAEAWYDPNFGQTYPTDSATHGTHTMGTMIGYTALNQIGMAPGAKFIGAKTVDIWGGNVISDTIGGFQWAADPDGNPATMDDVPDVVNNSWGLAQYYYGTCRTDWNTSISATEAAGVVVIFAAGNEGPAAKSLRSPSNAILSSVQVFSVGGLQQNGTTIDSYSSRGPSDCNNSTIKPEVVAVGTDVRSSVPGGGYQTMTGTSMAAPHVAGAVLLLREAFPNATPVEIKTALYMTAVDLGTVGEDNAYGRGKIDVVAAYDYLDGGVPPGDHCLNMDPYCNNFWVTYNPAANVFIGHSDNCQPGTVGYDVYLKLLGGGEWFFYLDFDNQGWPPDCADGDFGWVSGSGSNGVFKWRYSCVEDGPQNVSLTVCP